MSTLYRPKPLRSYYGSTPSLLPNSNNPPISSFPLRRKPMAFSTYFGESLLYPISEVKDRSVLRLRDQASSTLPRKTSGGLSTTPASPGYENSRPSTLTPTSSATQPPPSSTPSTSTPLSGPQAPSLAGYYSPEDEMNYFSEPEIDPDYRIRKSTSGGYQFPKRVYMPNGHHSNGNAVNGTSAYNPPPRPASAVPPGARLPPSSNYPYRGATSPFSGPPVFPSGPPPKPLRNGYPAGLLSPNRHGSSGSSADGRSPPPPALRAGYHSANEEGSGFLPPGGPSYNTSFDRHSVGSSDRSSSISRSGSVTPVVDEEARARMHNMESQLASLSSLVHSALMNKGVTETMYKDIEMMRREILGSGYHTSSVRSSDLDAASDNGSVSRFSDLSSEKGSFQPDRDGQTGGASTSATNSHHVPPLVSSSASSSAIPSPKKDLFFRSIGGSETPSEGQNRELHHNLHGMKRRVGDLKGEMRHLKRLAQVNAQSSRDLLNDAFGRIRIIINTNKNLQDIGNGSKEGEGMVNVGRTLVDRDQDLHKQQLKKIEADLSNFEQNVESLRHSVVQGERRLRLAEVEDLTNNLTHIGQSAAGLKSSFPTLQQSLKRVMSAEMEKVVREEKFLKEEPERLDAALRRLKKLTKTMVTMKKLAMVQDPTGSEPRRSSTETSQSNQKSRENGLEDEPPKKPPLNGGPPVPPPPSGYQSPTAELDRNFQDSREKTPTGPTKDSVSKRNSDGSKVLDHLLEELQTVGNNRAKGLGIAAAVKHSNSNGHVKSESEKAESPERFYDASPNPPGFFDKFNRGMRSMSTEPTSGNKRNPPPPPPPRSSSRSTHFLNAANPNAPFSNPTSPINGDFTDGELNELKQQLRGGSAPRLPAGPIIHTNALSSEEEAAAYALALAHSQKQIRSASSSESINSQESLHQPPGKPPPPPPPPRNRQELMEQRQMELLEKQKQIRNQYNQLQNLNGNSSQPQYPPSLR